MFFTTQNLQEDIAIKMHVTKNDIKKVNETLIKGKTRRKTDSDRKVNLTHLTQQETRDIRKRAIENHNNHLDEKRNDRRNK